MTYSYLLVNMYNLHFDYRNSIKPCVKYTILIDLLLTKPHCWEPPWQIEEEIVGHWKRWLWSGGEDGSREGECFEKLWQICILTLAQKRTPYFSVNLKGFMTCWNYFNKPFWTYIFQSLKHLEISSKFLSHGNRYIKKW